MVHSSSPDIRPFVTYSFLPDSELLLRQQTRPVRPHDLLFPSARSSVLSPASEARNDPGPFVTFLTSFAQGLRAESTHNRNTKRSIGFPSGADGPYYLAA